MKIESGEQAKFNSVSIKVETPNNGNMFVLIMEDTNGRACGIHINLGKAGTELSALVNGLARLCSRLLDRGESLFGIIEELSNNTADKSIRHKNGVELRSIVDAIVYALYEYNRGKYGDELRFLDTSNRLGG